MQDFLKKLSPYLFTGIALVAFAFGMMLLAYLLLFGALVGFTLFAIAWLKQKFFSPNTPTNLQPKMKSGRVIDSDHWQKW